MRPTQRLCPGSGFLNLPRWYPCGEIGSLTLQLASSCSWEAAPLCSSVNISQQLHCPVPCLFPANSRHSTNLSVRTWMDLMSIFQLFLGCSEWKLFHDPLLSTHSSSCRLVGASYKQKATGREHSEEESTEHLLCEFFHLLQMIQVALKEKILGFFFGRKIIVVFIKSLSKA